MKDNEIVKKRKLFRNLAWLFLPLDFLFMILSLSTETGDSANETKFFILFGMFALSVILNIIFLIIFIIYKNKEVKVNNNIIDENIDILEECRKELSNFDNKYSNTFLLCKDWISLGYKMQRDAQKINNMQEKLNLDKINIDMDEDYADKGFAVFWASLYKYVLDNIDNSERTYEFFERYIDQSFRELFTSIKGKDIEDYNYEENLNNILSKLEAEDQDIEDLCSKLEFEEFLKKIETYYNQYVQPSKALKILLKNSNSITNNEEKNTNHAIINIYLPTALLIAFVIKFATELFGDKRNYYEYGMVLGCYCYWSTYLDSCWTINERRYM